MGLFERRLTFELQTYQWVELHKSANDSSIRRKTIDMAHLSLLLLSDWFGVKGHRLPSLPQAK